MQSVSDASAVDLDDLEAGAGAGKGDVEDVAHMPAEQRGA